MQKLSILLLLALAACNEQNTENKKVVINEKKVITTDTQTREAAKPLPDTVATTAALVITPMDISGDPGQVTFSQKEKTVFYFDNSSKKGEITLSGKKYALNKYAFDSKKNIYNISGSGVKIITGACKFKENGGTDCFYGKIKEVTISMGDAVLKLNEVDVQDCPSY